MNNKVYYILALPVLFLIGRLTAPTPEAQVVYKDKIVIKEVMVENKNIHSKTKKTTTPDGTITEETETLDTSIIAKKTDLTQQTEITKTDISLNKTLFFSVSTKPELNPVFTYNVDYLDTKVIGRFGYGVGASYTPLNNDYSIKAGITFSFK